MIKELKIDTKNKSFNFIIFIPIISFICGFILNENSAGMGDYAIDSDWIRKNIEIFKDNNLLEAVFHPDLFGNRVPLPYIINKILNPFFYDYEKYRFIVFIFSLFGPIIFYIFLKLKFSSTDKKILFLMASLIYLSPYFRTSAYWGLNENYGIFTTFLSLLYLEKFKKEEKNVLLNIFLLIFFSSLTVYFDQKLLIVPLVSFLNLSFSQKINLKTKVLIFIIYSFFSIPYLYLIYRWQGIVPPATQISNPKTITSFEDIRLIYHIHIGYAATLIGFYLFPLLLFINKNIILKIKEFFTLKITYFFLLIFILFCVSNFLFFDFERFTLNEYWVGLGIVHKLSLFFFENIIYREIFTYIFFFFSFIVLMIFSLENKTDSYLISYFLFISLFLWPLMQEYFDPIIIIIALSMFKSVKFFNKFNSLFIFFYFSVFLIIANVYYT